MTGPDPSMSPAPDYAVVAGPPEVDVPTAIRRAIDTHLETLPGWCSVPKACWLAATVAAAGGDSVELGVFGGRGTFAMALGHAWRRSGRVVGIDPFTYAADAEGTQDPINAEWWQRIDHEKIYADATGFLARTVGRWAQILRAHSVDAARLFSPASITVLHQDSNHSAEVSLREIAVWDPILTSDGIWVMDDADWPSMQAARAEMTRRGWVVTAAYDAGHWLVWRRG